MGFDHTDYLSWYIPRVRDHDGAINLHSSGVPALDPGDFEVTPGDPWTAVGRFEAALAEWLEVPPDDLVFTPGATGGTLLALLTLTDSGDHMVVEGPIYEPMLRQAERIGTVARLWRRPDKGWRLSMDEAREVISDDTRLVHITEPHNPSGCFAPSQEVLELAELAGRHGAVLLINEVYRNFSDRPSYKGMAGNIVVVSSLSKLLGAYWARLGWLSGPAELMAKLRDAHLNMGMANSPAAETGLAVLQRVDELRDQAVAVAAAGRAVTDAWVQRTPGVTWQAPDAPPFGCISLPDGTDDVALAEQLHEEQGVLAVPGTFFDAPSSLRVSWTQSGERLEEGLELLAETIFL